MLLNHSDLEIHIDDELVSHFGIKNTTATHGHSYDDVPILYPLGDTNAIIAIANQELRETLEEGDFPTKYYAYYEDV